MSGNDVFFNPGSGVPNAGVFFAHGGVLAAWSPTRARFLRVVGCWHAMDLYFHSAGRQYRTEQNE